ncbi:MAG TPA: hypothetical protein VFX13_12575 [Gaiellales bacterium]|nr:hypothetical protein [Gaiellales bacterium]
MSSKSSAIGTGILIGAAAGAALYVMWRRARERRAAYEAPVQAPRPRPEPAPEPAQEAPVAPVAAVEPEPEAVTEPEPEAVTEPEPEVVTESEPVAEASPEPVFEVAAPEAHPPPVPVAGDGAARRQALISTGRPRDLRHAGWPQPMPLASTGGVRRPAPLSARASWPGVAAAGQMRPTPFRRIAPRGSGGPLHRTG